MWTTWQWGSSSHGRSTEDNWAVEQSHTSSSPRKKCLDGEKETEDFGMGAENSCSLVESYVQVSKSPRL